MVNPDGGGGHQSRPQQQQPSRELPTAEQEDFVDVEGPSKRTLQLWGDVAYGIDKNQTVVWKNAVDSLEDGLQHFHHFVEARTFVEGYMKPVISILLEQIPNKIGMMERNCVEGSLKLALQIIEEDLKAKVIASQSSSTTSTSTSNERNSLEDSECAVLEVLAMIFNKKKQYYKGSKLSGWNNTMNGLPDVRNALVIKFRSHRTFGTLAVYLTKRAGTSQFPSLDIVRQLLIAAGDAVPKKQKESSSSLNTTDKQLLQQMKAQNEARISFENDLIHVCKAVMKHMTTVTDEYLKKQSSHNLNNLRYDLQGVFDPLCDSQREETYAFYKFCREFALKLISSQSLPLKLQGWDTISDLIDAAQNDYSPPPKAFLVTGAGKKFVNGTYHFAAKLGTGGFVMQRSDLRYECTVPASQNGGKAKKITLFRCTMRSQQKWWFLSEADEADPGTDKDIDYYQHKSKKDQEEEPPSSGWTTCRDGIDPAPFLESKGLMVPPGEEYNTMEHQLAKWAIDNEIVELVLGSSIHREIVSRSITLMRFLAQMCTRDDSVADGKKVNGVGPNAYCLQKSHLTLSWNTCKSKLDPAVSAEVYHLLVLLLPIVPNSLAIHLLYTIQHSMGNGNDSSHLFEVAEFCSTLAASGPDPFENEMEDEVRDVVLKLLWGVLTHNEAHMLKCYQNLKFYVAQELRVEPMGTKQRDSFLEFCKHSLRSNSTKTQTDESAALRMVNLTQFILEACPQEQSAQLVYANNGELPNLIFNELISYLNRRSNGDALPIIRKTASNLLNSSAEFRHSSALSERLRIIRYIYGISTNVEMSSEQLDTLWRICDSAEDREAIMVFLASASNNETSGYDPNDHVSNQTLQPLTSSYSHDVRLYAFQSLFCGNDVDWGNLGLKAFKSFQTLFKTLKAVVRSFASVQGPALDTLWRICLQAKNDDVASQAMGDLLHLYGSMSAAKREKEMASQNAWAKKSVDEIPSDNIESFASKIYACLEQVRQGLRDGGKLSERSAERCIRILNAAIGHTSGSSKGDSSSIVHFKPSFVKGLVHDVKDIVQLFPHGLRGQACYRTISVVAKRAASGRRPPNERFFLQVHPLETLSSINRKVSLRCNHDLKLVRPISLNNTRNKSLNAELDSSIVEDLGIIEGSEVVFLLCSNPMSNNQNNKNGGLNDKCLGLSMSDIFGGDLQGPSDEFFETLLDVLEALPQVSESTSSDKLETQRLVWDLLQSVPSNAGVVAKVRETAQCPFVCISDEEKSPENKHLNSMAVDIRKNESEWANLLDLNHYQKAVYVLQVVDSFLQPSTELIEQVDKKKRLATTIVQDAALFRQAFIDSGGFNAVSRFFNRPRTFDQKDNQLFRRENTYIFRIIKCCLFGKSEALILGNNKSLRPPVIDNLGSTLLNSLNTSKSFFTNLAGAIVTDLGISGNAIIDALFILQSLFKSDSGCSSVFTSVPYDLAEKLVVLLLMWENKGSFNAVAIGTGRQIRKTTEELILMTPLLSPHAFPWLIKALDAIDNNADASEEYFSVLIRLIELNKGIDENRVNISHSHLSILSTALCRKLAHCPRPNVSSEDNSTGVLCGCLMLLKALIDIGAASTLSDGVSLLMNTLNVSPWGRTMSGSDNCATIINLMGAIFDVFLSDDTASSDLAICTDSKSRKLGFDLLLACANGCIGGEGYIALSSRIRNIITSSSPYLRHRWGQNVTPDDIGTLNASPHNSQYSGLRNQGCTCYMNSVLQQLFMMPELRKNLFSATLPSILRSSGALTKKGSDLIGKCLSIYWENGASYDAMVISYDKQTKMHTIRYLLPKVSGVDNASELRLQNVQDELPDEFILSEGRPGKETGVFDVIHMNQNEKPERDEKQENSDLVMGRSDVLKETEDETSYRRLLEEVQRTFVYLDKGSKGRVFDPRSLVEASGCLKLEFDIWQQNDASEFAMKLLDKLEVPLKRWSPNHFKYLEHTFRLKQTKQKLCKECGLKTNREENLMNIDCQIRGKSDIHEALSTMCEVEYMEGDNKVFCDNCKKNCDTVLRTAISALPDMLILSLKRFDLDYSTFETVKLNSRCAFDQSLNMKEYTLEGVEAMEKASALNQGDNDDTDEMYVDPLSVLPDDDYEYRLAGVLVHHGVAQGGHYYSFIKDRTNNVEGQPDKWFRFDDEDVTPFDASQIEVECFGGKVKKETKWPNGQVNIVETEQLANALMLFYEKVKPSSFHPNETEKDMEIDQSEDISTNLTLTTGADVFEGDVKRSNSVHRSHAFLFDAEFQLFIRQMLNIALSPDPDINDNSMLSSPESENTSAQIYKSFPLRIPILELSTSFFFDVLLHSGDKTALYDWSNVLSSAIASSAEGSKWVVHELAKRTKTVNDNWLRIFASDCPEKASRRAAMQVIASSMRGCLSRPEEITSLKSWIQAWLHQLNTTSLLKPDENPNLNILPVCLGGEWQHHEDVNQLDSVDVSSLGIIISYLCLLLELAPRTWQYNSELCFLLKEIGSISSVDGGEVMREALICAQMPARLIALLLRDKAPVQLQTAIPGASLSPEICGAIIRPITSSTTHMFSNGGSISSTTGVGTTNTSNSTPSPMDPLDNINTLEALALIIGIYGAKTAQLVVETGEVKGRPTYDLTGRVKQALVIVFNEFTSCSGLMEQKDIMNYMKMCGVDTVAMDPQRIINILAKYGNESKHLTIDGFISYYRETSQSNSIQLRSDLNTFGFRPDLSRCIQEARVYVAGERTVHYNRIESAAIDVFSMIKSKRAVGPLTEVGLSSLHLYHMAYFTDCHLTEYLLAWAGLNQNTNHLLNESLKSLYQAQAWGNETVQICIMILMVLAALPDDRQKQRIDTIMQSQEKLHVRGDIGSGLLIVAKELSISHSTQQYNADYHNHRSMLDRYVNAIKDLQKIRSVTKWMSDNKALWEWIDQFLRTDVSGNQGRGDYLNRRDRGAIQHSQGTLYEHNNSDSDLNGDLNESEESDGYDRNEYNPGVVVVTGAGLDELNGVYTSTKRFDNVPIFTKSAIWKGQKQEFSLFRCFLSDQSRRWYISIIPPNQQPGTNKDIDFYLCPATGNTNEVPHGCIWQSNKDNGVNPPPTVEWSNGHDDGLVGLRVTSNDEYDGIAEDGNCDDALMEDETQQ